VTPPAAVLDIDGTLVDSNYLHVVSWHEAFGQFGIELPFYLDLLGVRDDGLDDLGPTSRTPSPSPT